MQYIDKNGNYYAGDKQCDTDIEVTERPSNCHVWQDGQWVLAKDKQISAIDVEYQPKFASLAQSLGLATLDGNQVVIEGIKADYAALKAEYEKKREAINNG